jgi:hypothetical protein
MSAYLYNNIDQTIKHFLKVGAPYFIITADKKSIIYAQADNLSMDEAVEELKDILENTESEQVFYIYCYKTKAAKTGLKLNPETADAVISLKKKRKEYSPEEKAQYYSPVMLELRSLRDELQELKRAQELEKLTEAEEEELTEDELKQDMQSNLLGTILGNPAVQNVLSALLTNLTANLLTNNNNNMPQTNQYNRPQALAGTEVAEELELAETLEILFSKGVTLEHLKKLASYPKAKITMLLNML